MAITAAISPSIQRGVFGARAGGGPASTTVVSPLLTETRAVGSVGESGVGVGRVGLSIVEPRRVRCPPYCRMRTGSFQVGSAAGLTAPTHTVPGSQDARPFEPRSAAN